MIARLQAWLAAIGLALALAMGAWLKGRSAARAEAQAREDEVYRKTRGRIDAINTDGLSDDDVTDRLRDHAKRPRDL